MPVNGFAESMSWVMPTVNTVFSPVLLAAGDGLPDSSALAGTSGSATSIAIAAASAASACRRLPTLIWFLPVWSRVLASGHAICAAAPSKPQDSAVGCRKPRG